MDNQGYVCNIQVLLRAAEFLERKERGRPVYFMTTVSLQGRKLFIVKTTKCTMKGQQLPALNATSRRNTADSLHMPSRFSLESDFSDDLPHLTQ